MKNYSKAMLDAKLSGSIHKGKKTNYRQNLCGGLGRCGWIKPREYDELLYGRRFHLKPKGAAYKLCKASNTAWK